MENFKIIYKILKSIEESMDYEIFDENVISPEYLGVSKERWKALLIELLDNGYIAGIMKVPIMGNRMDLKIIKPKLTIKGMQYLEENSMMKKAYNLLKGIRDII
ncbi:YjcQ family protein [Leptotrichia shahii]|uniref:YjcQ family protein n=1 Tax=Leptotrichia shahii TaxID=157691 RepID=UPI0028D56D88|nr:YjcQ family protein [Leptotrichia shahii]